MKELIVILITVLVLLVFGFVGYRIGTKDQKYERDTGRDFASHRDTDQGYQSGGYSGGGHYGGGYGGGYSSYPRTRSYDDEDSEAAVSDTADDNDEGDWTDIDSSPKAPEF